MSNTKNPYMDMALNLLTNPWVLATAGGVAGYYLFGREDGKTKKGKMPYIAAGGGAVAGLAAGKIIQHFRASQLQPTQPTLPPGVTQAMVDTYQGPEVVNPVADYYQVGDAGEDVDVDQVFNQQPGVDGAPGVSYEEYGVPLQADMEAPVGLGSLDGTNLGSDGYGSLSRDDGFSAYDPGVEEALDDSKKPN